MDFGKLTEKVANAVIGKRGDMETPNDQSAAEKELVSYIKEKVEEIRNSSARITSEGQWLTNSAYLLGFTNLFYDTTAKMFRPINNPSRQVRGNRVEFNYILPNIQNRTARLTKTPPRYNVKPNSTSDEDREAARLGLYIINQIWDRQRINKKRLNLTMAMQQMGHAFLKAVWDPSLGPKVPFLDEESGEPKLRSLGDIRIDVCSPFEVFPDPLAKSHEDVSYIIHAKIRPLSYFRTHYPERGHMVKPEGVWLTSLEYQGRINSYNNQVGTGSGVSNEVADAAIELMYYEKPNYKHPNGRHVICANGVLLKDDELPIDELPFAKFDDILVHGKYNSESVITHLRSLQDQYNRTLTKRAQWVNRMLNGKYMVARGAGLKASALTDQSGEVVEYDPIPNAPPPTYLQTPNIPQYAYNEDDYIKANMNEVSGVGEISKGNVPSAGIPAIGMQFLQEMDDTRIGTITENNEYAYADVGRFILKFVQKYYEYPRTLQIAGKGMEYAVKQFTGKQLRGNTDVTVVRGSTLPGSKVLRRQEIINLHQSGYLGDPADPQVRENVLQMLEYGDVADVWKDYSLDKAQYEKHIAMIENEQLPPITEFDNHPLHIKELNRYRKTEKFDALSEKSQAILMEALEIHASYATEMMNPGIIGTDSPTNPMNEQSMDAQMMEEEVKQGIAEEMPMGQEMVMEEMPEGEF